MSLPDCFLDYDPLPLEISLRRSYAANGFLVSNRLKKTEDTFDTSYATLQLLDDWHELKCSNITEDDGNICFDL